MSSVDLGNTFGAAFLGVLVSAVLFGITNMQTLIYFRRYPDDRRARKISVAILWVLDALTFALTVHILYHYLVSGFGNYFALFKIVWSFRLHTALTIINICFVQSLYAIPIWLLGGHFNRWVSLVVCCAVVVGYGIGIVTIVETYQISTFVGLRDKAWVIYASFGSATLVDFIITGGMCVYLQQSRSPAGFSSLDTTLYTLMQYIISSGLATSACSTAALIAFSVKPNTMIFVAIQFLLTKLYVNSFLALLNSRQIKTEAVSNRPTDLEFAPFSETSTIPMNHEKDDTSHPPGDPNESSEETTSRTLSSD
jgi:hypothetical protein